ncbi:MAG: AMP-binding protein [Defluviitaleaceae bacterium]|nr:AMP-binding protein [Defluviitaleaceae bacterium]
MKKNVLEYLEQTVKVYPNKIAFTDGTNGKSFNEIYNAARSLGSFLSCYKRSLILVVMQKCPEMIGAFLGVAYSGNIYVPLDANMHQSRIAQIIQKLSPTAAVCDEKSAEILHALDCKIDIFLYDEISQTKTDNEALNKIRRRQIDTDPLYIVFTSGSTGEPKGIVANHRSVISYIDDLTSILGINESTVFGNQTPLYLDASLKEIYSVLKCGASAFLIPKSHFMFPAKLISYMNEYKINTVCWVSSAFSIISGLGIFSDIRPKYLHTIAFGSEVFPINHFNTWLEALPNVGFFNLYGPTEATGMSSFYQIDNSSPPKEVIPIGKAFPNTDIFIAVEGKEITEPETHGIIYIRGSGITLGYYCDDEKTNEVFIQNPLHNNYREIVYNTGDVGKYDGQGNLVYVCRNDHQIKRHGYRVELMEIEKNANEIDGVTVACCIYSSRFDSISLFYSGELNEKELLISLRAKLPHYMIPNLLTKLDFLPKQDNHKIDRAELLKLTEDMLNG